MAFKFFRSIYNDVLDNLKEEQAANRRSLDPDESQRKSDHTPPVHALASKPDKNPAIEPTPITTKCSTYSSTHTASTDLSNTSSVFYRRRSHTYF
jgi:hypothetical protein